MNNTFDNNAFIAKTLDDSVYTVTGLGYTQAAAIFVLRRLYNFDKKQAAAWIRENAKNFAANSGVLSKAQTVADEFFANVDGAQIYDANKTAEDNTAAIAKFMQNKGIRYDTSAHAAEVKEKAAKRKAEKVAEEKAAAEKQAQLTADIDSALKQDAAGYIVDLIKKRFEKHLDSITLKRIAVLISAAAEKRAAEEKRAEEEKARRAAYDAEVEKRAMEKVEKAGYDSLMEKLRLLSQFLPIAQAEVDAEKQAESTSKPKAKKAA